MSSSKNKKYTRQATVGKTEVVDDFFYDIDKTLAQFMDHWQNHRDYELDEISFETEGDYRKFSVEENNLYFEITAEGKSKAAITIPR